MGTSGQHMHSICSSLESQWSTFYSSQLNIFRYLLRLRRYKRKPVEVGVFRRGWATLSANFKRKGRRPPTTVSVRMSDCPFVRYQNIRSVLFRFVTKHACDRHTDRQTDGQTDRITTSSMRCAVKTLVNLGDEKAQNKANLNN